MKMLIKATKPCVLLMTLCIFTLSGCMTARSPVTAKPAPNATSASEALVLAGGTAAGAGLGYAITGDETGAAIGAGAGLLATAVTRNVLADRRAQRDAELIESGRRQERVLIMDEYWNAERRKKNGSSDTSAGYFDSAVSVQYEGGVREGVNFAPRTHASGDALQETARP